MTVDEVPCDVHAPEDKCIWRSRDQASAATGLIALILVTLGTADLPRARRQRCTKQDDVVTSQVVPRDRAVMLKHFGDLE